jgi:Na+/proline symporter
MRPLDWLVLSCALVFIVVYGVWKGRRNRDLDEYLLANRRMRWYMVALSIMATQASAITFLSTPGQAFADGMRFVQFYLGLPVAMVILSITAVPVYHRLKVYTAYEYLEGRFDLKTRTLAALLFLTQRGLAAGLTIYAPSVILSVIMGWDIRVVILIIGGMVTLYTTLGGTKAVEYTHFQQALIIAGGMLVAFFTIISLLPQDVSFLEAVHVAGKMGRLNAIDFSFDITNQYNFWSGLIGGCFLALAYFGTDQSQVQRYLTGQSVAQSRLGLLFNGLVKVPMQFFILFLGALVFVFYQFTPAPVFFNPVEAAKARAGERGAEFREVEVRHVAAVAEKQGEVRALVEAMRTGDDEAVRGAELKLEAAEARVGEVRREAVGLIRAADPKANTNDTNYVFLNFVIHYLPAGVVGLVLAAVFFASMSASASELNSLATTTVVDIYRRSIKKGADERHYLVFSRLATFGWGLFAILFAQYAGNLGSLVEAVNRLGSLFYGTILGIFLLAFYFKRVRGTAAFLSAMVGEAVILSIFFFTPFTLGTYTFPTIAFLWYNLIAPLVMIPTALVINLFLKDEGK